MAAPLILYENFQSTISLNLSQSSLFIVDVKFSTRQNFVR